MNFTDEMRDYIDACGEELLQLVRQMCVIPAPSHAEGARAAFCRDWFMRNGFDGVYVDEALNVVCPYGDDGRGDIVVFMAHTDVVFPDTQPLPMREDEEKICCPGVCDDTANLAALMICARYFVRRGLRPRGAMAFVANSCEEGLGNLKGSGQIVKTYAGRLRELITFDGVHLERVVTRAVGSHRYQVTVRTQGGHSYADFGNRNALSCLAGMVNALYSVQVPSNGGSKTTYNVGKLWGGTSVNTIAQEASMLYEYRSDDRSCLEAMQRMFACVIEAWRSMGVEVEVERVGERPCAGEVDAEAHARLIERADRAISQALALEPRHTAGSTDCNIPLSVGVPAICLSAVSGRGVHTREEELDKASLAGGCRLAMTFLSDYFLI